MPVQGEENGFRRLKKYPKLIVAIIAEVRALSHIHIWRATVYMNHTVSNLLMVDVCTSRCKQCNNSHADFLWFRLWCITSSIIFYIRWTRISWKCNFLLCRCSVMVFFYFFDWSATVLGGTLAFCPHFV